jgi:prepilin-type N-terminal cleavage/methylation domain-containing protein
MPHNKRIFCRAPRERSRGISLMEMIIVIVLIGIVAAMGSVLMGRSFYAYVVARDTTDVGAQGRLALERMEREIRSVRTRDASGMATLEASDLRFVDTEGNTVRFCHTSVALPACTGDAPNQLVRGDGINAYPLADNVSALTYEYLDDTGNVLAIPPVADSVFYITARMTVVKGDFNETYRVTLVPRRFE